MFFRKIGGDGGRGELGFFSLIYWEVGGWESWVRVEDGGEGWEFGFGGVFRCVVFLFD